MTKTPKLTDLDLVLLSGAAQRDDGMVLPPPGTVRAQGKTLEKSLSKLLRLGLVEECRADMPDQAWRHEDEGGIALRITGAGQGVLGVDTSSADPVRPNEERTDGASQAPETDPAARPAPAGIRPGTKAGTAGSTPAARERCGDRGARIQPRVATSHSQGSDHGPAQEGLCDHEREGQQWQDSLSRNKARHGG